MSTADELNMSQAKIISSSSVRNLSLINSLHQVLTGGEVFLEISALICFKTSLY